jgi:hypothetical protein
MNATQTTIASMHTFSYLAHGAAALGASSVVGLGLFLEH